MTMEKQIAQAILKAFSLHEMSYVPKQIYMKSVEANVECGKYTKSIDDCFNEACQSLPEEIRHLWYVLYLSSHWSNDLVDWAEAILNDKADEMFTFQEPEKV